MNKFLVNLCGFFFFCLLLFGVYYLRWDGAADRHRDFIAGEMTYHQGVFDALGVKVQLSQESVEVTGFPFSTSVRMYKPELRLSAQGQTFYLSTPYVDLIPQGDDNYLYEVQLLKKAVVSYRGGANPQETYQVFFSDVPRVWLRNHSDGGRKKDKHWNEYGVQLPAFITMDVAAGQQSKRAGFKLMQTGQPTWHYIPSRIDRPVRYLVELVRATARR